MGEGAALPLDSRCFFEGGSLGVAGDGGPERCMNFMLASLLDMVLLGLPFVAILPVVMCCRKESCE